MQRQSPEVEPFVPRRMGRYTLRRVLGRGAMGVVYEAHDTKDDALVALKTIASDHADAAEHLFRLKQEFRALADLQHPHLIRFGELASEGDQWFFTMELVKGTDFLSYVRPKLPEARRKLDVARLRSALPQLVSALSALHDSGRVHRDVKPSNVLVTEEGRVVVLDFGLVTMRTEQAIEPMSGTPAYMAPEQIDGTKVGPAADWYAVGAILFAALTGRVPFTGSTVDVMTAKLTQHPPAASDTGRGVPSDLDALCSELLRSDPEGRPSSEEIRARVGLRVEAGAGGESLPTFVGRTRELAVLQRAFVDLSEPRGRTVSVEGEPGIGKSALVQRFLAGVAGRALVLFGRCYEQESVPFKGIDTIVDALSEHLLRLPENEARAILGGGARFLATVFPVLNRVPLVAQATSNARSIDNPMALREQAFGEFERIISALSWSRKVILFLDDLQWADRDSLVLLGRVLHQREPPPCLFVATMRTGATLPAGTSELLADASRITLLGLSDSESSVLCSHLLQQGTMRPAAPVPEHDALTREAAGHPLYLAELVRSARRGEARQAGPVRPAKLQDVLWERVQERDPLERRFLEVLAIAGAPIAYEVVARAAGIDAGECQTRLGASGPRSSCGSAAAATSASSCRTTTACVNRSCSTAGRRRRRCSPTTSSWGGRSSRARRPSRCRGGSSPSCST